MADDTPTALTARLVLRVFRDREVEVARAEAPIELGAHEVRSMGAEAILGRFIDIGWTYRFGPPASDLLVATLAAGSGSYFPERPAQAFHHPLGRPVTQETPEQLGLRIVVARGEGGIPEARIEARRLVHVARLAVPGHVPSDDGFSVAPGESRAIVLQPALAETVWKGGTLAALNLAGSVALGDLR